MRTKIICLAMASALAACSADEASDPADVGTDTEDGTGGDAALDGTGGDAALDGTGADTIDDGTGEDAEVGEDADGGTDTDDGADTEVGEDAEVDTDTSTGPVPRGAANPPTLGSQIDRMGRPAIATALIGTFSPTADAGPLKDAYNLAEPADWAGFSDDMEVSLAILDSLDTVCGNQLLADNEDAAGRYAALAGILADDQLYLHSDRGVCGTYLGLEAEVVGALEDGAGGCGGRTLSDDVIERSYSLLAAGALVGIDDTIAINDQEHLEGFPFLASPAAE